MRIPETERLAPLMAGFIFPAQLAGIPALSPRVCFPLHKSAADKRHLFTGICPSAQDLVISLDERRGYENIRNV